MEDTIPHLNSYHTAICLPVALEGAIPMTKFGMAPEPRDDTGSLAVGKTDRYGVLDSTTTPINNNVNDTRLLDEPNPGAGNYTVHA